MSMQMGHRAGERRRISSRATEALAVVLAFAIALFCWSVSVTAREALGVGNASSVSALLRFGTGGVPVFSLAFSPDGSFLVGAQGHRVAVWDPMDGTVLRSWPAHPQYAAGLDLSFDGLRLATAGSDAVVRLWDTETGALLREFSPAGTHAVDLSHDGRLVASGGRLGELRIWDVESGELLQEIDARSRMFSVAFSPEDSVIVTAHGLPDFAVRTWSVETGELLWESFDHEADAHVVCFSPSGDAIASVGADTLVILWDAASGEALRTLRGHRQPLFEALFISDELLATGDGGGTIRLWDVENGRSLCTLTSHRSEVCALAISGDGLTLASASFDMEAILWSVP